MKVSEITIAYIKNYLRLDDDSFNNELGIYLQSAKNYVASYTGLPLTSDDKNVETIDSHEDITTAVLTIISDYYENHLYHQGGTGTEVKKNALVDTTLNLYRQNLV